MDFAVGSLSQIVGVAVKIKEAAETARQNKEDCDYLKSRIETICDTLQLHEENTELMKNPVMRAALEKLDKVLAEALKVVTDCQEERNIVCVFYTAGDLSKQLNKVERRITDVGGDTSGAIQAYLAYHLLKQNLPVARPLLTHSPELTTEQFEEYVSTDLGVILPSNDSDMEMKIEFDEYVSTVPAVILPSNDSDIETTKKDEYQDGEDVSTTPGVFLPVNNGHRLVRTGSKKESAGGDQLVARLLRQIAEFAREIKEAVKKVRRNKEDCMEITKRASGVSGVLSSLKNTDMMDEETTSDALKKLLGTLGIAQTLVIACQGISIWPKGKLAKQLREVLDQMLSDINAVVLIIMNCTLELPQRFEVNGERKHMATDNASATEYKQALAPDESRPESGCV